MTQRPVSSETPSSLDDATSVARSEITKPRKGYLMITKLKAAVLVTLTLPLAACVEDTGSSSVTPARATMAQVETACVNRLAGMSNVSPGAITVTASTGSSEGSAVFLNNANGAPWICRADGAGQITEMEFQGEG